MTTQRFQEGDQVLVPWGLDRVKGTVEVVAKWGERWTAEVLVELPESDEPETILVPLETLEPIDDTEQPDQIGAWLDTFHYQEALFRAVAEVLRGSDVELENDRNLASHFHLAKDRSDIQVQMQDGRTLIIEAKKVNHVGSKIAERATRQLQRVFEQMGTDVAQRVALVVFSEEFGAAVQAVADRASSALPNLRFATWRGEQDNPQLRETLTALAQ